MFKFNSGHGAIICDTCRKILNVGWVDEHLRDLLVFCDPICIEKYEEVKDDDHKE